MDNNHDELKRIREILSIKGKCNVKYFDDPKYEKFYRQLINNLKQYGNSPDCITKIENYVFPVEHFELDSYKNNKNGSVFRKEGEIFKKEFIETNGTIEYTEKNISIEPSVEYLVDNFNKVFDKHYKRIPIYCENIKRNGLYNECKVCNPLFMIEIKDPFIPVGINANGEEIELNLIYSDLLIKKLESSNLNGIILIYYTPEENYIYILLKQEESLRIVKEKMYNISSYKIKPRQIDMVAVAYFEEEEPEIVFERFRKHKINGFRDK